MKCVAPLGRRTTAIAGNTSYTNGLEPARAREYVRRIGNRYSMIRDPNAIASASTALVEQKDPTPLNVYERSVFMARLPDGRLQLISQ